MAPTVIETEISLTYLTPHENVWMDHLKAVFFHVVPSPPSLPPSPPLFFLLPAVLVFIPRHFSIYDFVFPLMGTWVVVSMTFYI